MRRALTILVVLAVTAALTGVASLGSGDGGDGPPRFSIVLDNAFGVVEGGDVKIAGVRAGKVSRLSLEKSTMRARVEVELYREGFADLRRDTFCEVRPQSLIGEYFIDCLPGVSEERLGEDATVPVEQTGATVPGDLVANILRRPYRERFALIFAELGTAVAARGQDLNAAIRRGSPALRATNRTLAAIAQERRALAELVTDARVVVQELSGRRRDVSRFVREARDTAVVSARREDEIAAQWRLLPGFLRELRPTMRRLGVTADRTTPALARLRAQAGALDRLLDRTVPFVERTRPFTRTLAALSAEGSRGVVAATARARELRAFAGPLPEVATNLAGILEDLDSRDRATEPDPRSPGGGKGFTGLESLMRFVWAQQQASNVYDGNSYLVKQAVTVIPDCSPWASVKEAREEARKECRAQLGPSRPGIDTPDPTLPADGAARRRGGREGDRGPGRESGMAPLAKRPAPPGGTRPAPNPLLESLPQLLQDVLPTLPDPGPALPTPPKGLPPLDPTGALLDYLLGA